MTGIAARVPDQIILMLLLSPPPGPGRHDFGDDGPRPLAAGVDLGLDLFGDPLLLGVVVKDGAAVAGADVVPLAVAGGGVVQAEEEAQQGLIAGLGRVEFDAHRLGVPLMVAVGGVGHVAAGVADLGGEHPRLLTQQILHPPEAAAGQGGDLERRGPRIGFRGHGLSLSRPPLR